MAFEIGGRLLERLRALPHVTAAAPGLYGQVLISRGARSGGALIKGIIPAEERTVSDLLKDDDGGAAAQALEPMESSRRGTDAPCCRRW